MTIKTIKHSNIGQAFQIDLDRCQNMHLKSTISVLDPPSPRFYLGNNTVLQASDDKNRR